MTMENYNWIKAYYASQNDDYEREIFVRQEVENSETFVDDKGNRFHISELDLTRSDYEPQLFNLDEFEKRNKEINQKYQESQAMYMEMLSKMDANSIVDHNAEIAEREYYRKLRGDIMMEVLRQCDGNINFFTIGETVKKLFEQVHSQDADFFMEG